MNNNIEKAQELFQAAYDIDIGFREGPLDMLKCLDSIGPRILHQTYYGPISGLTGIQAHLQEYPKGIFATLIRSVRDAMVSTGEYTKERLSTMYGLSD